MKRITLLACLFLVLASFSYAKATRVDSSKDIELDGYWSDSDVKIVSDDIVAQILESPRIQRFRKEHGRDPIVTIGKIKNSSDEYIDTKILANSLKTSIIKSGYLEFMADEAVREKLREELRVQADHANEDAAKALDNEDAADFMLTGSIKTMVQDDGKKTYRVYYVTIELNDLETHRLVDSFEPSPDNVPRKIFKSAKRK